MTISPTQEIATASIAEVDPVLWEAMQGSAAASTTRSS